MEAVGAIASIAGILSLTGQAMNGIIILRGFFQSCSSESRSIERFLKRLNELIQILEHASDLIAKLRAAPSKIVPESILASLQIQLDDCNKDVYGWLATAKTCLPASNTGTKAAFKKFLVALERQRITDIYVEISAYKENIMTKLSVIGRCFDIDQSATLETLCKRLKTWEEFEQSINFANGEKQDNMVSSYEIVSQPGSSSSLASIAESLARIENRIGDSIGPSRSQYGSQSESIGSFNSASVSGGRSWNSEPSQYTSFTTPHSLESMLASLPERITQSLLGVRRQEPPKSYASLGSRHDEAPTSYGSCHEADQHLPEDDCLGIHYEQSTQMFNDGFTRGAAKYIDLILLAETIIFKIKLFRTTPSILFSLSEQTVESEINALEAQLCTVSSEAKALQISSWRKGFNTHDLDSHISRCRRPGPDLGTNPPKKTNQGDANTQLGADNKFHLETSILNATQHDRINMWLLNNLEVSNKEKKLHRSFLPQGVIWDEEQWARLVLKHWLLDEAATGREDRCFSSNGAVNSDGRCHSERVLFENLTSSGLKDLDEFEDAAKIRTIF